MVICLERGADLHMAQLMPLPLTVSCSSKIQIDFTFLVPAHPGSPGQKAIKRVCVCVVALRPTQHKTGKFADVWLGVEKSKPNTTKACVHRSKKNQLQHKINTKKLKPDLVAFYDIRPGNAVGLFSYKKISKGGEK